MASKQKMERKKEIPMSSVKRERQRKKEKLELRAQMRAELPILRTDDVRKCRMEYYLALLLRLEEEGFVCTHAYITQLLQHQEKLIADSSPDAIIHTRLRLSKCRDVLDDISSKLKQAELANRAGEVAEETDWLLKLGVAYAFGREDWWWIGEQFLRQATATCVKYTLDGRKRLGISRFVLGKFILENAQDVDEAIEVLNYARLITLGKSWYYRDVADKPISFEVCTFLNKALMAKAKSIMAFKPAEAGKLCRIARSRATEACYTDGEAAAITQQAQCSILSGDIAAAIKYYEKVLKMYIKANNIEAVCKIRIQISIAFLMIGNLEDSLIHLKTLMKFSAENSLMHQLAEAHRYLGEYYINQGDPKTATPLLLAAVKMFHELRDYPNREQAKNFAAISLGQERLPQLIHLINKCGPEQIHRFDYLMRFVAWKNSRSEFWELPTISVEDIGAAEEVAPEEVLMEEEVEVEEVIEVGSVVEEKESLSSEESFTVLEDEDDMTTITDTSTAKRNEDP